MINQDDIKTNFPNWEAYAKNANNEVDESIIDEKIDNSKDLIAGYVTVNWNGPYNEVYDTHLRSIVLYKLVLHKNPLKKLSPSNMLLKNYKDAMEFLKQINSEQMNTGKSPQGFSGGIHFSSKPAWKF